MPVGEAAAKTLANYLVQQWYYTPTGEYGGAKKEVKPRTVKSAQVSPDGKKVYLEIEGLMAGQVVYIACNANLKSSDGKALFYTKSWYTLNNISTSEPFTVPVGAQPVAKADVLPGLRTERVANDLRVILPGAGTYAVELVDFQGRVAFAIPSAEHSARIDVRGLRAGLYVVRAHGQGRTLSRPIVF
jgi:hypothetical protein